MAEAILCKECNKNEATVKCTICGKDLCESCQQVVQTEDISASHRVKGMTTEGVLGPAQKKMVVCAKCMAETDFFEHDEHEAKESVKEAVRTDRLKYVKRPKKGKVTHTVGTYKADLTKVTPDIRGKEELVKKILDENYIESKFKQYESKIRPFSRVEDINEWDKILLNRYKPLYTVPDTQGKKGAGAKPDTVKLARNTLDMHVRAVSQTVSQARSLLDEAIKAFGPEKEIDMGTSIVYPTPNTTVLTGSVPQNLSELNEALEYAEAQLIEQMAILAQKTGDAIDLESRAMHTASLGALAAEVEEVVKINCFDSLSVGNVPVKDTANYPECKIPIGLGTVDKTKPVLSFFGDDFYPIMFTVGRLEEEGLSEDIEITGLGNAGHELCRIYQEGKIIVATTGKAVKGIRAGIPDLVVASNSCFPVDIIGEAEKAGVPVLAAGPHASYPAMDMTEESPKKIARRLSKGKSALVRDVEKAGDVAVEFFKAFPGKMGKAPDKSVIEEAKKKCRKCDTCFYQCPNNLPIASAIAGGGSVSLSDLYDRCLFCGKCEAACPAKIPIVDCILASSEENMAKEKSRMRAGRGPLSHIEFRDLTFGLVLGGNGPGLIAVMGCGHNPGATDELADIAVELLDRNCAVMTAGCGAAEIASRIDEKTGRALPENYLAMATLKGLVNCGGCSGDAHIMASMYKLAGLGGGISIHGNFDQPADYNLNRAPYVIVIWGPASERMMVKATSYARAGASVVIGPSAFEYNRSLVANQYDRSVWKMYDGNTGTEREVDPSPPHLIYPVETKEEAVTMAMKLCMIACALRDSRLSSIDNYTDVHQKYFESLPEDWSLFLRSPLELPVMKRMKMLNKLKEKGWEIEKSMVNKVHNRDGRLISMEEYTETYGIKQGQYATMIKRLIMR